MSVLGQCPHGHKVVKVIEGKWTEEHAPPECKLCVLNVKLSEYLTEPTPLPTGDMIVIHLLDPAGGGVCGQKESEVGAPIAHHMTTKDASVTCEACAAWLKKQTPIRPVGIAVDPPHQVVWPQAKVDLLVKERDAWKARFEGVKSARDEIAGWLVALRACLDAGAGATTYTLHPEDLDRVTKLFPDPDDTPLDVLEEAASIVGGARQAAYGPPERSFDTIAAFWSTYLGVAVKPRDVALLMVLMKTARDKAGAKRDNLVDIAGYARCAEIVGESKPTVAENCS